MATIATIDSGSRINAATPLSLTRTSSATAAPCSTPSAPSAVKTTELPESPSTVSSSTALTRSSCGTSQRSPAKTNRVVESATRTLPTHSWFGAQSPRSAQSSAQDGLRAVPARAQ